MFVVTVFVEITVAFVFVEKLIVAIVIAGKLPVVTALDLSDYQDQERTLVKLLVYQIPAQLIAESETAMNQELWKSLETVKNGQVFADQNSAERFELATVEMTTAAHLIEIVIVTEYVGRPEYLSDVKALAESAQIVMMQVATVSAVEFVDQNFDVTAHVVPEILVITVNVVQENPVIANFDQMVNPEPEVKPEQESLEIIMQVNLEATKQEILEKTVLEILAESASAGQVNSAVFLIAETLAESVEQEILGATEKNAAIVFVGVLNFAAIAEENHLAVIVVKPDFVGFVNVELENLEFAFFEQHHFAAVFVKLYPVEVVAQYLNDATVIFEWNLVAVVEFLEVEQVLIQTAIDLVEEETEAMNAVSVVVVVDLLANQVFGMPVGVAKIKTAGQTAELVKQLFAIASDEFVAIAEQMLVLNEFVVQTVDVVTANSATKSAVKENFQKQEEAGIYLMSAAILIELLVEIALFLDQPVAIEL